MAVLVQRLGVVVDEVDPGHELGREEVRAGGEARRGLVGDPGVDDRHRGPERRRARRRRAAGPRRRRPGFRPGGRSRLHWSSAQPPGTPAVPWSNGVSDARAIQFGVGEAHAGIALERGDPVGDRGPGGSSATVDPPPASSTTTSPGT